MLVLETKDPGDHSAGNTPCVGHLGQRADQGGNDPAEGDEAHEEARLFYVAATRDSKKFLISVCGHASFSEKLTSIQIKK